MKDIPMSGYYLTYKEACKLKPGDLVQCHAHGSGYMYTKYGFRIGSVCKVVGKSYGNYLNKKDQKMISIESPSGIKFMLNEYECGMFHKYKSSKTK